jgi:hypothetical protein
MDTDKVFNQNSNLVHEGDSTATAKWLLANPLAEVYIRSGATGELMSRGEFLGVYVG